jgi:carboxypeptidase Q
LTIENKMSGETTVNNVIAEIRGSERPDEWILIGAHLDSWDFGTGAQDNGTGAISVLEVGRALMALGKAPRRSIRLALWGRRTGLARIVCLHADPQERVEQVRGRSEYR